MFKFKIKLFNKNRKKLIFVQVYRHLTGGNMGVIKSSLQQYGANIQLDDWLQRYKQISGWKSAAPIVEIGGGLSSPALSAKARRHQEKWHSTAAASVE